MGISVCIIARDEEASLPECVKSVQSIADEIIVVDTGSTDATVAIARRMGCRVFSFPWNDDFAAARNYALEQAREEWILSIDCDERLRNPEVVRRTLQAVSPKVDALLVRCISPAEHRSTSIALVARLFRRHQEIRFRGRIHEQVVRLNGELRIARSEIELWHEGYARGEGILRAKHERNFRLLQQALSEEPENAYLWLQYARSALVLQRLAEASQALQQALQMSSPESLLYWQIRCWQAQVALSLRAPREALRYSREVLQRYPGQTFAASIAAEAYVMLQEWYHAATFYEQWPVWQEQPTTESLLIGHLQLSPAELAFRLGRCYVGLGRWEEAERLLREGLESETDHLPCRLLLTELLITRGRLAEADSFLQDLRRRQVPSHLLEELLRHRCRRERTTLTLSRPLLSLSMIVRNEAERIAHCLESLRGVVDEIVVVDTGSSDTTIEVAQSYGARVYSFPWNDSFAAARNESLRHCTGEWILYLDADEQLHPASLNILRDFLCDLPDDVGGVACTIESPHRHADGTIELHWSAYPRIFRNYGYPTIRFHGRVHEQISPSILALGKQIIRSPLRILHSGYDQSPEVLQAKAYRNYRLLMLQVQEEPLDAYAWYQLGQTLARLKFFREAEEALQFALHLGTLPQGLTVSAAMNLAQLCLRSQRYTEALSWAEHALHYAPDHALARFLKAQSLRLLGRRSAAAEILYELLSEPTATPDCSPTSAAFHIALPLEAIQRELELLNDSMSATSAAASPLSG